MSRVSAHRARGWASLTKNKTSPPPLEILLRDLLSRARHRRQRGHERPVRKVGKEDAAAVLRGEAGELGRRVVEADAPRGEALLRGQAGAGDDGFPLKQARLRKAACFMLGTFADEEPFFVSQIDRNPALRELVKDLLVKASNSCQNGR